MWLFVSIWWLFWYFVSNVVFESLVFGERFKGKVCNCSISKLIKPSKKWSKIEIYFSEPNNSSFLPFALSPFCLAELIINTTPKKPPRMCSGDQKTILRSRLFFYIFSFLTIIRTLNKLPIYFTLLVTFFCSHNFHNLWCFLLFSAFPKHATT